jgi:hypothetical protein
LKRKIKKTNAIVIVIVMDKKTKNDSVSQARKA